MCVYVQTLKKKKTHASKHLFANTHTHTYTDNTSRLTQIKTDMVPVPLYDTIGTVQGPNLESADI